MIEDIEGKTSSESRLEITKNNLEFFGDLIPTNGVLSISLGDYQDRARFSVDYINSGLKEALETPAIKSINIKNASIILYDDDGMKGLFIANKVPDRQCRVGLPGFIPDNSRSYYGVIWGKDEDIRVYSSFGSELFDRENHKIDSKDLSAVHSLYYAVSDFALKITSDPVANKKKYELIGIRSRSTDID